MPPPERGPTDAQSGGFRGAGRRGTPAARGAAPPSWPRALAKRRRVPPQPGRADALELAGSVRPAGRGPSAPGTRPDRPCYVTVAANVERSPVQSVYAESAASRRHMAIRTTRAGCRPDANPATVPPRARRSVAKRLYTSKGTQSLGRRHVVGLRAHAVRLVRRSLRVQNHTSGRSERGPPALAHSDRRAPRHTPARALRRTSQLERAPHGASPPAYPRADHAPLAHPCVNTPPRGHCCRRTSGSAVEERDRAYDRRTAR
jgi:hypothetical protein